MQDGAPQQGAARVAALLGELGAQLAEVLPDEAPMAAQLRADLDPARLEEALAVPHVRYGSDLPQIISLLGPSILLLSSIGV